MKPGLKTTEFWRTLAANVLGVLVALGVIDAAAETELDQIIGLVVAGVADAAYAVSRGIAKLKETTT